MGFASAREGAGRAACLGVLLAATLARAGQPGHTGVPDYTRFWLNELTSMDAEYGAAGYDEKLLYTPASVTVIDEEEIAAYGWRTLGDVLSSVRGFHISYDRSYDYIGARGFGRPGDYNTRVLILCDGHPINDMIYGSAFAGAELYVDMSTVRQIRIMHGPSAVVYGDGAFFAVVDLITRDGDDVDVNRAGIEAGSAARRRAEAAWGGRTALPGALYLAAAAAGSAGEDLYWPEYDAPETNDGVFVDGDRERTSSFFGKWNGRGAKATVAWSHRRKWIPTGEWGLIFNDNSAWGQDDRLAVDLSVLRSVSDRMAMRARLSYDEYEYIGNYPFDDDAQGPADPYTWRYTARGRWWGGEVQWSSLIGGRHRILAGANFRRSIEGRQIGEVVGRDQIFLDLNNQLGHAGIYVQDQWILGPRSSLYVGLRQDSYRSFGPNLSLRSAVVAHIGRATLATLAYGEAFRAPNAYELYYDDGEIQAGNPDLLPELVDTWELSCDHEFADGLCGSVSLFDNRIERLIEQSEDPRDGRLVFVNSDEVHAAGIEFELDGRLREGLNGRLSVSGQRAANADDVALTNAPARLLKLNLATSRFDVPVAGAVEVQHVSRRRTLADNWAPAYAVVNLDATWWTPLEGLQLDLAIDNALDQEYGDPGGGHQVQDVLARDGRRWLARLSWRW